MVQTRTGKGQEDANVELVEMEELRARLEQVTREAATAKQGNDGLRKQLNKLIELNERLLLEKEERENQNLVDSRLSNNINNQSNIKTGIQQNVVSSGAENISNNVNSDLVQGILDHFRSLQVQINPPIYNGESGNPVEYLDDIEKYFLRKRVAWDQKLLIVEDSLKGRAKAWYEARLTPFMDFAHFKSIFLKEFYSVEARVQAKAEWDSRRFKVTDGTLLEYFTDQRRIAKYFKPSLDAYEGNYGIIKQLPQRARDALAVIDYADTELIAQALSRLDASYKAKSSDTSKSQSTHNATGPLHQRPSQQYQNPTVNFVGENSNDRPYRIERSEPGRRYRSYREQGHSVNQSNWRDRGSEANAVFRSSDAMPLQSNCLNISGSEQRENNYHPTNDQSLDRGTNISSIKAVERSEFIRDLCWDVNNDENRQECETDSRIISPRVHAQVFTRDVIALLDSGSEITCVSETLYTDLKYKNNLSELPVSNLLMYVAVGRKAIRVVKKVYLTVQI